MTEKTGFDWKDFIKRLCVLAIPVALQNLLTSTASMVDTMMLAQLGEQTVGAVGLCAQFSSLMISGYWGFVGGGMLFFAQYWGAKDDDGIDRSYGLTLTCMMTVAAIFSLAALLFPELVMAAYTDKTVFQTIGVRYLRIVGFAYPMQVFSMSMSALLRSTERVKIPLCGGIGSVVTNITFNAILIPIMGVEGAAVATVMAAAVNVIIVLLLARRQGYPYLFHFRRHFMWKRDKTAEYFRKCFPIICNEVFIGVGNMLINFILGRQPEAAIPALAVLRTIEGLVIGFWSGFSNAASVLVGAKIGSGELETAYQRAKRIVFLCAGTMVMFCAFLIGIHRPVIYLMSLRGESLAIGSGLVKIYAAAAVIRMCNWVQNDTYRSAGDAVTGTVLEIVFMYLVLLPCVYAAGFIWKLPTLAVFACCYIDEPIRFIIMQIHMYSGKWIRPVTEQGQAALPEFMAGRKKKKTA